MDLSAIKPSTIEIAIVHPGTGEPTGFVLTCISPQDPAAAGARRALQNKAQRGATEEDAIEFTAALVQSWEWGDADWSGEKLSCTRANVKKVLGNLWVRKQVDAALGDESNFFRA